MRSVLCDEYLSFPPNPKRPETSSGQGQQRAGWTHGLISLERACQPKQQRGDGKGSKGQQTERSKQEAGGYGGRSGAGGAREVYAP